MGTSSAVSVAPAAGIQYILYYRHGQNPYPQFRFFALPTTDMKRVIDRAKRHCEVMGYRFVSACPAFVNFDEAEGNLTGT